MPEIAVPHRSPVPSDFRLNERVKPYTSYYLIDVTLQKVA